ncbi:MAG: hypothetical protein IKF68_04150 [Erysipelotrichaceae bacterium]|nr:hypothetical protein [Erysipelotrichaceae bacterium]
MEKKRSSGITFLKVLVILILIIICFLVYIVTRMSLAKISDIDIDEVLNSEIMDLDERVTVNEKSLEFRLDRNDICYLINSEYGADYFSELIDDIGTQTGIAVDHYDLKIENNEVRIAVAAHYNVIPLAAEAVLEPYLEDGALHFGISKIDVAGIPLRTTMFKGLEQVDLYVEPDIFILEKAESVRVDGDTVCLSGPLNKELLKAVDPKEDYDRDFTLYIDDHREILDAGLYLSDDEDRAVEIFLEGIKDKGFAKVVDDYFTVVYPGVSNTIMKDDFTAERILRSYRDTDFLSKFRPSSDRADLGKKNVAILANAVYSYFNLGRIDIKDSAFRLDGKEFRYEDLIFEGWEDTYGKLLKGETFRLVLIDDSNAFKGDVGPLSRHIDTVDSIDETVDPENRYTLGFICETSGGLNIMAYNIRTDGAIGFDQHILEIDDDLYEKLSDTSKVHVYRP